MPIEEEEEEEEEEVCTLLYITYLYHVSFTCFGDLTASSGRTYVFLIKKHRLLRGYCLWYSGFDLIHLTGEAAGSYEHGSETWGSIKCVEFE